MNCRIIISVAIFGLFLVSCKHEIKIACIGDSITEGAGTNCESKSSYPVILDSLLGYNYAVLNCGRSGATVQRKADWPYWKCKDFYNAFLFKPEIIIIALGTNDSKDYNWNPSLYEKDFQSMIDTVKTIATRPRIYVCLPPPAFQRTWSINDSTITVGIIPIIKKLQKINNFELIDLNQKLRSKPALFPDGIHPNDLGAKLIAEIIAGELKK
jgi:alpha-L-fucosidase 2